MCWRDRFPIGNKYNMSKLNCVCVCVCVWGPRQCNKHTEYQTCRLVTSAQTTFESSSWMKRSLSCGFVKYQHLSVSPFYFLHISAVWVHFLDTVIIFIHCEKCEQVRFKFNGILVICCRKNDKKIIQHKEIAVRFFTVLTTKCFVIFFNTLRKVGYKNLKDFCE